MVDDDPTLTAFKKAWAEYEWYFPSDEPLLNWYLLIMERDD